MNQGLFCFVLYRTKCSLTIWICDIDWTICDELFNGCICCSQAVCIAVSVCHYQRQALTSLGNTLRANVVGKQKIFNLWKRVFIERLIRWSPSWSESDLGMIERLFLHRISCPKKICQNLRDSRESIASYFCFVSRRAPKWWRELT